MDKTVYQQAISDKERLSDGDFAALFEQLDRIDAIAPVERGMECLVRSIAELRRLDPARLRSGARPA